MKFRIAKKIVWGHCSSWKKKFNKMRPPYYNDKGRLILPSIHDLSVVQKALKVFRNHVKRNKKKWNL